jgi:hypothetical protein
MEKTYGMGEGKRVSWAFSTTQVPQAEVRSPRPRRFPETTGAEASARWHCAQDSAWREPSGPRG